MLIIAQITGIIYKNIKTDLFNGKGKQYYNIKRGIIMPNFTQLQQQLEAGIQNNINAFLASNKNPNQNFINAQIQTIVASKTSELRHKLLQDYAQYCGRNVISYYSTWLQSSNLANPNPELMINDNDMNRLSLLVWVDQTAVVLVQGLQDHAHSQPETQDEVLQGHGAADLILCVDEPEQQRFFFVLQQGGEFLLALC